jgi:hypothetical protein
MDFPNCSLVNASPVNNGPPTIYQTTMQGHNGQQTDLFSSGMQYSSKLIETIILFLQILFQLLLVQQLIQLLVFNYNKLQLTHYLLSIQSILRQLFILIYQRQRLYLVH